MLFYCIHVTNIVGSRIDCYKWHRRVYEKENCPLHYTIEQGRLKQHFRRRLVFLYFIIYRDIDKTFKSFKTQRQTLVKCVLCSNTSILIQSIVFFWSNVPSCTYAFSTPTFADTDNDNDIGFCPFHTLGARGLHAPHPDGRPKAGKTSGLHEANEVSEVLVASDLWFQPSKISLSC